MLDHFHKENIQWHKHQKAIEWASQTNHQVEFNNACMIRTSTKQSYSNWLLRLDRIHAQINAKTKHETEPTNSQPQQQTLFPLLPNQWQQKRHELKQLSKQKPLQQSRLHKQILRMRLSQLPLEFSYLIQTITNHQHLHTNYSLKNPTCMSTTNHAG